MLKTLSLAAVLACSVVGAQIAWAHPGHDHGKANSSSLRTWTDASGDFQIEAAFVSAQDGQVKLWRKDDKLITLPLKKLSPADQAWIAKRMAEIRKLNTGGDQQPADAPLIQKHFAPFANTVKTRWDNNYFYVESNGLPAHPMMIGITAWQQQVPLPQPYNGDNAWRIPLHPTPAKQPMSAKTNFFRGAIALAVNGVPIFNPIKNDGRTDTLLAGELDQWGGHCGRGDDYHYHIAPVHLEKKVGPGNPVAYALDGYPIYGYQDPKSADYAKLDWLNGHKDAGGNYHYHATKTYPYLNGGFYGEVVERGGQVDPQPRAQGLRPFTRPLRGAKIVGFENPKPNNYILRYEVFGEKRSVEYTIAENGAATFRFVSPQGTVTETYEPRQRRGGGNGGGGNGGQGRPMGRPSRGGADGPESGGDLLQLLFDADRDGILSAEELKKAPAELRAFDRNRDGKLDRKELGLDGQREGNRRPRPDRSQAEDGPRQPWILVHAKEVDAEGRGVYYVEICIL